jgi:putative DNA primase/helicase
MTDLRATAGALGGDLAGRDTILCPGPGHSPRDRSLAVRFDPRAPDGFVTFSHANDDWRDCRDLVRSRLSLPAWQPGEDDRQHTIPPRHVRRWDLAVGEREWNEPPTAEDLARIARARELWDAAGDPCGTLAERYLAGRCLELAEALAGHVLRFHPGCPWRDENTGKTDRIRVLLAAFRSIDDDKITAVHRIRVDQPERWPKTASLNSLAYHQRRASSLIRALLSGRSSSALRPLLRLPTFTRECELLAIAAMSSMVAIRLSPLGSAGAIENLPVLTGVERLVLLAEHDEGGASLRATDRCGSRWLRAGRRVARVWPAEGSNDLNDELIAQGDRKMLGIVRRAAVKLGPVTAGTLAVAEGLETAMAAQQLGYRPAWAEKRQLVPQPCGFARLHASKGEKQRPSPF